MACWDPQQYLKFGDIRTRPSRELVAAVRLDAPRTIIDLGCGPGNSTAGLAARWPAAAIVGLDGDAAMIAAAKRDHPRIDWQTGDITAWAQGSDKSYDLVFTNAALQWVPDHAALYPALLSRVTPGGALAVQVPENTQAPGQVALRELAASPEFRADIGPAPVRDWHVLPAADYYNMLAPLARHVDLWRTEYLQVLSGDNPVVDFYRGSALRPYLERLPAGRRAAFLEAFTARMRAAYPRRADGATLFPFMRLFVIAYR